MESHKIVENISLLFKMHFGVEPQSVTLLPLSGSDRKYYRIVGANKTVVGAYNPDVAENIAFLEFTKHFHKAGLPVPVVICEDEQKLTYLLSDLGDTTLFATLPHKREQVAFSDETISFYKKVLELLPEFQIKAAKGLNYDVCYPRMYFDRSSMMWDLNYFKYYFLKLGGFVFDEQKLEDSFNDFVKLLSEADSDYFLYRDFQSRNIMLVDGNPYFIDYQGGRKGALQYDVASLLYDAKANIPYSLRNELLEFYISNLHNYIKFDEQQFRKHYYAYVLVRVFQAMGAYGFRGFIEKKPVFLQSVPYAISNLEYLLDNDLIPSQLTYLKEVIAGIVNSPMREKYEPKSQLEENLTVRLYSFSYKKGLPVDLSGNGGGFVFDCRALPNPGREEQFRPYSGLDKVVIEFLKDKTEVSQFLENCEKIVDQTVQNYISRKFTDLMISFGCTGGQHRSVYCTEKLAKSLSDKYNVEVIIEHIEKQNWPLRVKN
ncbi:MAG: phosphotransferase [Bacteroidetes bacterium]|nr:phosphotransferase [Bacteroidota bacterium]